MTDEIKDIGSYPMEPLRMRYFAGQFLEAKDFTEEQAYHVERRRRLNRELFGRGVRRGFSVTMRDQKLHVQAGSAIDKKGSELWLEKDLALNEFSLPPSGAYLLCMHLEDIETSPETYVPLEGEKGSQWTGNTRTAETIIFSLIPAASAAGDKDIILAGVAFRKDGPAIIDESKRHVSTILLGAGLTVNPTGHYIDMYHEGKLNAFVGADRDRLKPDEERPRQHPGDITFSSMSRRLHLTSEEDLYVLNKKGMVISRAWYPNAEKSGSLRVDGTTSLAGKTTMENGLSIASGDLQIGPKKKDEKGLDLRLTISHSPNTDENLAGPNLSSEGRIHISGNQELVLLNKKGVIISKSWSGDGSLHVEGNTSLGPAKKADENGKKSLDLRLTISHSPNTDENLAGPNLSSEGRIHISGNQELVLLNKKGVIISKSWSGDGSLHVEGNTSLGPAKKADENGKKSLDLRLTISHSPNTDENLAGPNLSSEGRIHISGNQELVLLNKKGVIISKSSGGDGSLLVEGKTTMNNGLSITSGGLQIGATDAKVSIKGGEQLDHVLSIAGATLAHNAKTMGDNTGPELSSKRRLHISGDKELFLLNTEGVIVYKGPYKEVNRSGRLEVQGPAIFRDNVMYSSKPWRPTAHPSEADSWDTIDKEIKAKLTKDGDFTIFADNSDRGHLYFYWRSAGQIKRKYLGHNNEVNNN